MHWRGEGGVSAAGKTTAARFERGVLIWCACVCCKNHKGPAPRTPPQIGHAGDGGLYAELVQDRSFDAIARASGVGAAVNGAGSIPVDLEELARLHRHALDPIPPPPLNTSGTFRSREELLGSSSQNNAAFG